MLALGLGAVHLLTLLFHLVDLKSLKSLLNMGGVPAFNLGSNPPTSRLNNQLGEQFSAHVSPYNPTSSTQISTNKFGMTNPPLFSGFQLGGGQFHTLGNPQPGSDPAGGSFYNYQQNIPVGMMSNQPYMNQPKGGPYNAG
jgi:hypothetical protein